MALPSVWWEGCVKGQLQSLGNLEANHQVNHQFMYLVQTFSLLYVAWICVAGYLIFNGDFCSQGVVSVPLLCEGQAVLRPLVFGFQGASHFAGVGVGGTGCFELLQRSADRCKQVSWGGGWVLVMYECNGSLEETTTMLSPWSMAEEPKVRDLIHFVTPSCASSSNQLHIKIKQTCLPLHLRTWSSHPVSPGQILKNKNNI